VKGVVRQAARIADFGLRISLRNPQSTIRNQFSGSRQMQFGLRYEF
jgi:hypothetical protein